MLATERILLERKVVGTAVRRMVGSLQPTVCSIGVIAATIPDMKFIPAALYVGACALLSPVILSTLAFGDGADVPGAAVQYTPEGLMRRPQGYREWVYLTSGMDMTYSADGAPDHHMFDNVFVNPESYKAFLATGTWPEGTAIIIESRGGASKGSINKGGLFQTTEIMGIEVHVKDSKRFAGSWAFFGFDQDQPQKMLPQTAQCYSCHAAHAAVDTTFVQFYPTLLPIAQAKGTLSAGYKKDIATE